MVRMEPEGKGQEKNMGKKLTENSLMRTFAIAAVMGLVFTLALVPNVLAQGEKPSPTDAQISSNPGVEEAAAREWFGSGLPWWKWSRMTGDWGGLRSRLEKAGVILEGSYIVDVSGVWSGGIRGGATTRSLFDVNLTLDLETMVGLEGATLFADYYSEVGRDGSRNVGDIQAFSNIDSDNVHQLAELWYEQWLFSRRLRIKVGKVEANSEFAFVDAAGEFINSSGGFSPTVFTLPTYPDPAMSVNAFAYPTEWLYFGLGVYDGALNDGVRTGRRGPSTFFNNAKSDDYFLIGELGVIWPDSAEWGAGRFAVGPWYHSGNFARFDGSAARGTEGFYTLLEQRIWRENPGVRDDKQGLSLFFQYGYADRNVSEINHHVGVGLFSVGPIRERDDDAAGIMLSFVDLSDASGAGFTQDETALELFYRLQVTPHISVKPDLHYIIDPSGDRNIKDALVGTLRVELTL